MLRLWERITKFISDAPKVMQIKTVYDKHIERYYKHSGRHNEKHHVQNRSATNFLRELVSSVSFPDDPFPVKRSSGKRSLKVPVNRGLLSYWPGGKQSGRIRHRSSYFINDISLYLFMFLYKVQILESGASLLQLAGIGFPLVRGTLEVVLFVVTDAGRQKVVHDHYPNVDTPTLKVCINCLVKG